MRRIFKVCLCGLTAAALITGCSKGASSEGTSGAQTGESSSAAGETTAAGESAAAGELIDLSQIDNGTITLGKYKGVEVAAVSTEVTDEEVDAQIQGVLDSNPAGYDEITDRGAQEGDVVNIDYTGMKDGVAFEGGTDKGFDFIIGQTSFIDGFKEGLMGAKTGDELELNLTFPDPYSLNPELSGQAVVFKVTVNSVKVPIPATLDDAFVKKVTDSKFQTVADYKADIRKNIEDRKKADAQAKKQSDVLTAVMKDCKVEASQEAIDAVYNNFVVNYTEQAAMYGMDLAGFASLNGMDEESFKATLKTMSQSAVEQRLLFNAIAKEENIVIGDQDRKDLAADLGYESAEAMLEQIGQFDVDDYLISTKTMDFLTENAVEK